MKKSLLAFAAFAALCVGASAQTILFNVTLSGASQVPSVTSSGTGSGTLTLNTSAHTLTFNSISFSGLGSNSTAAHIHGPADTSTNAGVLYGLDPTYMSTGSTSGLISGTLTLVDGTGGYTIAQQETQLQGGQWYINVHTVNNSGGEIRGQITAVPEPAAVAAWLGAAGLVWAGWRRRRVAAL